MSRAMSFNSILVLIVLSAAFIPSSARFSLFRSSTKVNKIFVFGDSTVDVGNNNDYTGQDSEKVPKANFKPYGIDLKNHKPTGRFSNGYNIIDYIAKVLGFEESPPAYLARGSILTSLNLWRKGANFASGGSGVLDSTRSWLSMSKQIELFKAYDAKITINFLTHSRISKSLFVISTGSNDVFNFYKPKAKDSNNLSQMLNFIEDMVNNYTSHVKELYNLGARKFLIFNVGMIGCCPISRMTQENMDCNNDLNELAQFTNFAIEAGMEELRHNLGKMKYSIVSNYAFMFTTVNPSHGVSFRPDVKYACCKDVKQMCSSESELCRDRSKYLFWDMMHGTQATAEEATTLFFHPREPLNLVTPISIRELIET